MERGTAPMRMVLRHVAAGLIAAALATSTGCDKPKTGPKRADHAAAHSTYYHPDVQRRPTGQPETAASRPEAATQPVDFRFGRDPAGSPVMFVNGENLTVADVLEPIIDDLAPRSRSLSENAYRDFLVRRVVEQISMEISRIMIYQEARKTFPDKLDEAFAKEADKIIQEVIANRFGGVKARYEAHLKALDLTLPEMKERAKRQVMVGNYLRERFKPMIQNPPRSELLKYYQQHRDEFTTPAKAELFLIEIPIEAELGKPLTSALPDEMAAARERALNRLVRAREEIESGIAFADVARQYSKGLQAARGGEVGEISPGALTGRWARAAEVLFTLEEGQMSDPVDTPEAVFLIKCGKRQPAHQARFEESQSQIMNRLMDEQFNSLQRRYILELEAKATVRKRQEFTLAVLSAAPRPPQYDTARREAAQAEP